MIGMDVISYKENWQGERLLTYAADQLTEWELFPETQDFLMYYGLPVSCAPSLSFKETLETPGEAFNTQSANLNGYIMIGSNEHIDPICIDLACDNEIVILSRDTNFERRFINSSLEQLGECLILYRNYTDVETLKTDIRKVDRRALNEDSFWGFLLSR
jgi:hypothetical protein